MEGKLFSRREFLKIAGATGLGLISLLGERGRGEQKQIWEFLESVPEASGYRYDAKDDQGNGLDTLKIIENSPGDYLGVYHSEVKGVFYTKLARSFDLLNWQHLVDLESGASQPTITRLPDRGFLVAFEKHNKEGNQLVFRSYGDWLSLRENHFQLEFAAPRSLSQVSEGTPNFYLVNLSGDIQHSEIEVGFHFAKEMNKEGKPEVDRVARGKLVNFCSWTAWEEMKFNNELEKRGLKGSIGDRDYFTFWNKGFLLQEGQLLRNDFSSWRIFLFDFEKDCFRPLEIKTHQRSFAFANPTLTFLASPSHKPAFVVTLFLPHEAAAQGEAGELIYYKEISF